MNRLLAPPEHGSYNIHSTWFSRNIPASTTGALIMNKFYVNPLRAKFFRGNINIYLYFVSFPHIDTTRVFEIFPHIRQELTYST